MQTTTLQSGFDTITSEAELTSAFRIRDQKLVDVPSRTRFPLAFEYYLTWGDPGGVYRYLVFRRPKTGKLTGMVFRRSHQGAAASATRLCDWCHAYGPSDQIGLLTTTPSAGRTIGMLLCLDLGCLDKLEVTHRNSRKGFDELAEDLINRIDRFYEANFTW